MSVFIGVTSFGLHFIAYRKGWQDDNDEIKRNGKKDESDSNPLISKWLDFGGGYYGTVAFVKLVFIELADIRDFLLDWQGIDALVNQSVIGLIIAFFVEQYQNFVAAIIWPTHYLGRFSIFECFAFVAVTYMVYEWSRKQAKTRSSEMTQTG
jgi:hypothetical protein